MLTRYLVRPLTLLTLALPAQALAQAAPTVELLVDINPAGNANPSFLTPAADTLFFTANGTELWTSDGTTGGTSAIDTAFTNLFTPSPTALGERLFFVADDGTNGLELWSSDGTTGGTQLVSDINPGAAGSLPSTLTVLDNTLYFLADSGSGRTLWTSDGASATPISGVGSEPASLTVVGDLLYFIARTPATGREVFRYDPADQSVSAIDVRSGSSGSEPSNLTAFDGQLFFSANGSPTTEGTELWSISNAGDQAQLISDINDGTAGSSPTELTAVGDQLFFTADDGNSGRELWVYDSAGGARLAADIAPGSASSTPSNLTAALDRLFFTADNGTDGVELWVYDGTAASPLGDINAGGSSAPRLLTEFGGRVYFSADDGSSNGRELWTTDGSAAGTVLVEDINPGADNGNPTGLVVFHNALYFAADNGTDGVELWRLTDDMAIPDDRLFSDGFES